MAKIKQIVYTPQPEQKTFLEKASDFVGTTALGKRIGGAIYGGSQEQKQLGQSVQAGEEIKQKLALQIQKNKSIGRDTSRLEQALTDLNKSNVQSTQAYEGLPTGGVTNKEVLGSTLQTAAFAPGIGALAKGVTTAAQTGKAALAGRSLAGIASPVKTAAVEGFVSGALGGAGAELGNRESTAGSAISSGLGYGVLGAGLGAGAAKALPVVGQKIGGAFARFGSPAESRIAADAVADLNKALPPAGKKTAGSFIKNYTTSESSERFSALQALYERNKGKTIKTLDGLDKEFDPTNVQFGDLPYLYKQTGDELADEMINRLSTLSDRGMTVDTSNVIKGLRQELKNAVTKEKKTIIQRYIDDFDGVTDPLAIRAGLSEIGSKVGNFLQTGANKTEGTVATKVYKDLETTLNNFFAKEQAPIKELYDQFSALKKLEFDITKAVSKELRDKGNYNLSSAVDDYGLSLIGSGIAYGSPMQVAKGGLLTLLKGAKDYLGNPSRALNSAFKKVDEYYTKKGITSVIPPNAAGGMKLLGEAAPGAPKTQLPSGPTIPVTPTGSAMEITRPVGVADYGAPQAPKSKPSSAQIRAAQETQIPYIPDNELPVIEVGSASPTKSNLPNVDMPESAQKFIESLPPEQQDEAKKALQTLISLSQKKNLEGGFSKLATLLTAAGISGAFVANNVLSKATGVTATNPTIEPKKEVSSAKVVEQKDGYAVLSKGAEVRPVPKKIEPVIEAAAQKHNVDPTAIKFILSRESSMLTNKKKDVPMAGKFGWIGGVEEQTYKDILKQAKKGVKSAQKVAKELDFSTEEKAINSIAAIFDYKRHTYNDKGEIVKTMDDVTAWLEKYNANPDNKNRKDEFAEEYSYYKNDGML